jgi:hypothetical protein
LTLLSITLYQLATIPPLRTTTFGLKMLQIVDLTQIEALIMTVARAVWQTGRAADASLASHHPQRPD